MAVISLIISAPLVGLACVSLAYDIFYKGRGLTEVSVKLFVALILAATGGLAASRFSKRTYTEMTGAGGPEASSRPPGTRFPKPQGEQE